MFKNCHDENPTSALVANQRFKNKCVFCKGSHWSDKCEVITNPSATKKLLKSDVFVTQRRPFESRNCQTKRKCYYCKGFHNSSVCETRETQRLSGNLKLTNLVNKKNFVLLQTADVVLFNGLNKKEVRIKGLFDGESQRSYVSKRAQNILSPEIINKEKIKISIFSNINSKEEISDYVKLFVKTEKGNKSIEAFSISLICLSLKNQPVKFAQQTYTHLKNLNFADSGTGSGEIDLLIGSGYLWEFVSGKVKCGTGDEPRGTDTVFSYVLSGPVANTECIKMNHQNQSSITTTHVSLTLERSHFDHFDGAMNRNCHVVRPSGGLHLDGRNETSHYNGPSKGNHLEKDFGVDHFDGSYTEVVSSYWDLETIGIKVEEPTPVEDFLRNIKMNENTNRYETSLQFKHGFTLLPDNYELCRKRLMSSYKTLKNDPELLETYDKIFKEQLSLRIIEQIDTPHSKTGQVHCLPHHPVLCFDKETTKVCAVFDASAKVKGNPSLNNCLHKGPNSHH